MQKTTEYKIDNFAIEVSERSDVVWRLQRGTIINEQGVEETAVLLVNTKNESLLDAYVVNTGELYGWSSHHETMPDGSALFMFQSYGAEGEEDTFNIIYADADGTAQRWDSSDFSSDTNSDFSWLAINASRAGFDFYLNDYGLNVKHQVSISHTGTLSTSKSTDLGDNIDDFYAAYNNAENLLFSDHTSFPPTYYLVGRDGFGNAQELTAAKLQLPDGTVQDSRLNTNQSTGVVFVQTVLERNGTNLTYINAIGPDGTISTPRLMGATGYLQTDTGSVITNVNWLYGGSSNNSDYTLAGVKIAEVIYDNSAGSSQTTTTWRLFLADETGAIVDEITLNDMDETWQLESYNAFSDDSITLTIRKYDDVAGDGLGDTIYTYEVINGVPNQTSVFQTQESNWQSNEYWDISSVDLGPGGRSVISESFTVDGEFQNGILRLTNASGLSREFSTSSTYDFRDVLYAADGGLAVFREFDETGQLLWLTGSGVAKTIDLGTTSSFGHSLYDIHQTSHFAANGDLVFYTTVAAFGFEEIVRFTASSNGNLLSETIYQMPDDTQNGSVIGIQGADTTDWANDAFFVFSQGNFDGTGWDARLDMVAISPSGAVSTTRLIDWEGNASFPEVVALADGTYTVSYSTDKGIRNANYNTVGELVTLNVSQNGAVLDRDVVDVSELTNGPSTRFDALVFVADNPIPVIDDVHFANGVTLTIGHVNGDQEQIKVLGADLEIKNGTATIDGLFFAIGEFYQKTLFRGTIEIDVDTGLGVIKEITDNGNDSLLGGLVDINYKADETIKIGIDDTRIDSDLAIGIADLNPISIDPVMTRFTEDGRVILPSDIVAGSENAPVLDFISNYYGWAIDFSEISVRYDVNEEAFYFGGKAVADLDAGLAGYLTRFGLDASLTLDLSGDENFIRLRDKNGDAEWDIVGQLTYKNNSETAFIKNATLTVDTIDASFGGSVDLNLPFTDVDLSAKAVFGYDPFVIKEVKIGLDGLDVPLGTTGLALTGGSLLGEKLDNVFGEKGSGEWYDAVFGINAKMELYTPGDQPPIIKGSIGGKVGDGELDITLDAVITPETIIGKPAVDALAGSKLAKRLDKYLDISIADFADFKLLEFDGAIKADLGDQKYSIDGSVGLLELLNVSGDITLSYPKDVFTLSAKLTGQVSLPKDSLGGGKTLSATGKVSYSHDGDWSNDYVALWTTYDVPFWGQGELGFKIGFDMDFDLLGTDEIQLIASWDLDPSHEVALLTAYWENDAPEAQLVVITPEGQTITEAEFDEYDFIALADDLNSSTQRSVALNSPYTGRWDIQMVQSEDVLGETTYEAVELVKAPRIEMLEVNVPLEQQNATIAVTLDEVVDGLKLDVFALNVDTDTRVMIGQIDTVTGTLAYTFEWDFANEARGSYEIEVETNHPDFVSNSKTALNPDVMIANIAPVAKKDQVQTEHGTAVVIQVATLLSNDSDAEGDTLSIAAVTSANGGSVAQNPDGTMTFTPDSGFSGEARFSYTVNDGFGGSDTETVTVVVGAPPLVSPQDPFTLEGTPGPDELIGTSGAESIKGFAGNDLLEGKGAADKLYGGGGNDILNGGSGKDKLFGGSGNDKLLGGGGKDTLKGGGGNDKLKGGGGNDKLVGGGGADNLKGQSGKDTLKGGGGDDVLKGGGGKDKLDGGGGTNKLTGNGGADTFLFKAGKTTITDYKSADKIDLKGAVGRADLDAVATVSGGDLVLEFSSKNVLTIKGVTDLDDLNFI